MVLVTHESTKELIVQVIFCQPDILAASAIETTATS